jgi:CheY-like chemotaxis protein
MSEKISERPELKNYKAKSLVAMLKTNLLPDKRNTTRPQPTRPKILAVDDQRDNLAVIEAVLSKLDAEIVLATSGGEALEALENDTFALVLLDVSMPAMDGFEVAHRIRQSERKIGCVPVILVTGVDRDEQSLGKGYSSGAVDFVYKPVNPNLLRHKVEVFLTLFNERRAWETANQDHLAMQWDLTVKKVEAENTAQDLALQIVELERRCRELSQPNSDVLIK